MVNWPLQAEQSTQRERISLRGLKRDSAHVRRFDWNPLETDRAGSDGCSEAPGPIKAAAVQFN